MRYMLDTNICIYLTRHDPPSVRARFVNLREGDAVMSSVTYAELFLGVELDVGQRTRQLRVLDALSASVVSLPFDDDAARSYARLTASAPERKKNILDRMIAAHAIALDVTLVTNNERDFVGYAGLLVENWVHPV